MSLRAVPGSDLSGDPGHESGSQPMRSLKGAMAAPFEQQPMAGVNTGPVRGDLANATDKDSPTSGHLAGATWTYGGTAA